MRAELRKPEFSPKIHVAKRGRPTDYSPQVDSRICKLIVEGKSLRTICKMPGMPVLGTIFVWLTKHEDFKEHYARARELQAEIYADEIVELSDNPLIGKKVTKGKRGNRNVNETVVGDNVERSKLQVDARKWVAVKLLPKKYGVEKEGIARKDRLNEVIEAMKAGPVK